MDKKMTYNVGDVVRLKLVPTAKFIILEATKQICYANCVQEWYTGRVTSCKRSGHSIGKMERYSVIELEPLPDVAKEVKKLELALKKNEKDVKRYTKEKKFREASEANVVMYEIKQELKDLKEGY